MITLEEIKTNLQCSDVYAQKLIECAQGDEKKLENLYYQKLAERLIRPAIVEY
ncbi:MULTISPECIES: hypothetical protein [Staphylococcus]|uniref:hypothetical protein n=1 Tax=Staphylococcus TaxID=1279 RepID=UPI001FE920C8|nr:hypothetical protein [Staphylococcus pasteuri]MEB6612118.1 hypothetical protein [Staphylococcus pasteuri]